jgi:nicotinamidase-related amidase
VSKGTEVGRAELAHHVSGSKLDPKRAVLVVVDVQEAFRKAIPVFDDVAEAAGVLVEGAKAVGIPVVATEQYPKGLGHTVPEVADHLPEGVRPVEKLVFSAAQADGFDLGGADQALVCGIETHVCVNQTVVDLLARGIDVHVAEDAVASRSKQNWKLGLHKLEHVGATLTSVETALFELVGRAGTDEFKRVQKLILEWAP